LGQPWSRQECENILCGFKAAPAGPLAPPTRPGTDGSRFVIVWCGQNPSKGAFGVGYAADP
jgi:hypothetical protein